MCDIKLLTSICNFSVYLNNAFYSKENSYFESRDPKTSIHFSSVVGNHRVPVVTTRLVWQIIDRQSALAAVTGSCLTVGGLLLREHWMSLFYNKREVPYIMFLYK
jgi:hypothetical protein